MPRQFRDILRHRRPLGRTDRNERVTCIDRMEFDDKGQINPVRITAEGVGRRPLEQPLPNSKN